MYFLHMLPMVVKADSSHAGGLSSIPGAVREKVVVDLRYQTGSTFELSLNRDSLYQGHVRVFYIFLLEPLQPMGK